MPCRVLPDVFFSALALPMTASRRLALCALLQGVLALAVFPATAAAQEPDASFAVPKSLGDGWETEDLRTSGFDAPRLRRLLAGMMSGQTNLHGIIIERRGHLVAELYRRGKDSSVYFPIALNRDFGPDVRHDTRSIGKSVIGLLFGIVQGQGKIGDLATPALDFYPENAELATAGRQAITLEHLLTMSSGLEWSEGGSGTDHEHRLYWKWSPYRYVFDRAVVAPPGSKFNYNSGGTAVLADILTRVTKTPLKELVRRQLFGPLGITDWEWVADLHGRPMAFVGLRLRPRDLAKLGRLIVNHGRWRDRQIVPEAWIEASFQPRIGTGIADFQYGYQWWLGSIELHGRKIAWGAAFGNGGQRLFVVPELDLVVVVTAGAYGDPQIARQVDGFFKEIVATLEN